MNRDEIIFYVIPIIVSFLIISIIVFNQFLTIPLLLLTLSSILLYSEGAISKKVVYLSMALNILVVFLVLLYILYNNINYRVYNIYINGMNLKKVNHIKSSIPFKMYSVCVSKSGGNPVVLLLYKNFKYYVFGFSCKGKICCKDVDITIPPNITKLYVTSRYFNSTIYINYINENKLYEDFLKSECNNSSYCEFLEKITRTSYYDAQQSYYKLVLYEFFPYMVLLCSILTLIISLFTIKF